VLTLNFKQRTSQSAQSVIIDSEEDIIMMKLDANSAPVVKGFEPTTNIV